MKKIKLQELELKVIKVLWKHKEATVGEIREALKGDKDYAITTISTVLQRFYKKDIVDYRKEGRQFIYRPLISEREIQSSMTSNLIEQLFDGKSSVLVNHLLEADSFEADELENLKKMIEAAQKNRDQL